MWGKESTVNLGNSCGTIGHKPPQYPGFLATVKKVSGWGELFSLLIFP